ncbi:MAG: hypothetical protein LC769_08915, partial [Chloroflexi bacterium]|nr:hypothetical protein [Chloroflexota bacterium]
MRRDPLVTDYYGSRPATKDCRNAATVGIEDAFLKAIAWRESNWRMVDAADGGIGVMQLMPDTV